MSIRDFFAKLEWEGGTDGACSYGLAITDYDIPDAMALEWGLVRDAYDEYEILADEFLSRWDPDR